MSSDSPTPPHAGPPELAHDLVDAETARQLLRMSPAKFELLLSTNRLRSFRSNERICFRREDIVVLASKLNAAQAKASRTKNESPATPAVSKKSAPARNGMQPKQPSSDDDDDDDDDHPVPKPQSNRARRIWFAVGGMGLALAAVALTLWNSGSGDTDRADASSSPALIAFNHCKAAPGLVESATGEHLLSFEVAGRLRAIYVEEGQTIRAGTLICELENADLIAKLKSSQADLSGAEAKLAIVHGDLDSDLKKAECDLARLSAELLLLEPRQEDIDQARAESDALEADSRRMSEDEQKLSNPSGLGSSWSVQLYDQARGLAAAARARCDAAKSRVRTLESGSRPKEKERTRAMLDGAAAELARQKSTRSFQLASAQAQVDQCNAQVELARAELAKTRLVSPINGTVVHKYMHPGEVIDALSSRSVVTVADLSNLCVRADVDETDFPHIGVGQRVKITADALEDGKFLNGTVTHVCCATGQNRFSMGEGKERMDVKIVETIVQFDAAPSARLLKLGLRVTAYFEVSE